MPRVEHRRREGSWRYPWSPQGLRDAGWALLLALTFAIILPGAAAIESGAFNDAQVQNRANALKQGELTEAIKQHDDHRNRLKERLRSVDKKLTVTSPETDLTTFSGALTARKSILEQQKALKMPAEFRGYFNESLKFVYLVQLFCLSLLLLATARRSRASKSGKSGDNRDAEGGPGRRQRTDSVVLIRSLRLPLGPWVALSLAGYAFQHWPNWIRNILLTRYEAPGLMNRRVYAYTNWDISPAGFILQELIVLLTYSLLAAIWIATAAEYARATDETNAWRQKLNIELSRFEPRANYVSRSFETWEADSFLLLGAFFPWTWFYYHVVRDYGDPRYILSSAVIHLVWGISWLLITSPLLRAWGAWRQYRYRMVAATLPTEDGSQAFNDAVASRINQVFTEAPPLSASRIATATIAATVSFFLPLIQLAMKP